jgi:hypothetical protein
MKVVRIIKNADGTYSGYIYAQLIYTGTYEDVVKNLNYQLPGEEISG